MFTRGRHRSHSQASHFHPIYPSIVEVKTGGAIPTLHHTSSCRGAKLLRLKNYFTFVKFEVLTGVFMNSSVFWDITPYSQLKGN
jgi:hypothetical protein